MECPAFMYLKDVAMASWQMAQQSPDCKRCSSEWKYMRGVCDSIFMKLKELKTAKDEEALETVKRWLSKKKNYPVTTCVLYYRRSKSQGKIAKLEF